MSSNERNRNIWLRNNCVQKPTKSLTVNFTSGIIRPYSSKKCIVKTTEIIQKTPKTLKKIRQISQLKNILFYFMEIQIIISTFLLNNYNYIPKLFFKKCAAPSNNRLQKQF